MRMARVGRPTAVLGLIALAMSVGRTARGEEAQWFCSAHAFAAHAGMVDVQIYVHRDGSVVGRDTLWSPPRVQPGNRAGEDHRALDLSIGASGEGATALRRPDSIVVSAMTSDAVSPAALLVIETGGAKAKAVFDEFGPLQIGGPAQRPARWDHSAILGSEADNATVLTALATAPTVTATITADDGRVLTSTVYDLRGRAEAIRIARRAWREAEHRRQRPLDRCDKTQ